jgi:hypothetical protein
MNAEPNAAETYFGSWGLVVVLTASALGKDLSDRSLSRARMISFGSANTGIG